MKMNLKSSWILACVFAVLTSLSVAAVGTATVDGVGGAATADVTFPLTFDTVENALVAVRASALNAIGNSATVEIVAANAVAEGVAASLNLNTDGDLTIEGKVAASAYGGTLAVLRLTASDAVGSPAGTEGIAVHMKTGAVITLKNLILIPNNATLAGAYNQRMVQAFGSVAGSTTTANFENVFFTARKISDNSPVINPFVHAASADTRAARNAELSAFDGGGGNNAFVIQNLVAPTAGAMLTFNFKNCVFTHLGLLAAAGSKGGGIAMARTTELTVNINEGCVFSFLDGSGIRGVGTLNALSTAVNVNGTASNPVFFYKNGWMEDAVNTARNEGIQNDGSPVTINYAYFIKNYQEGLDKLASVGQPGNLTISNTVFAENCTDLDTTNGTAPITSPSPNLKITGNTGDITLTNVTIYDSKAPSNAVAFTWANPSTTLSKTLSISNAVIAGAGDTAIIGAAGFASSNYVEDDVAIVQAGADALASPFITDPAPLNVIYAITNRVTADPQFVTTAFAPVWVGLGVKPTGLDNYLAVNNTTGAYCNTREAGAQDVKGANPNGVTCFVSNVSDWLLF